MGQGLGPEPRTEEPVTESGLEVGREAGTSPARERRWGAIGGILGALYGTGPR